jgi:hypothetical protein
MITLRDIFTACAPESLERSPHRPMAHRKVISAIQQCQSGHDGHSLSQCQHWGGPTASIMPVATATVPMVSIRKPRSGSSPTSSTSSPDRAVS